MLSWYILKRWFGVGIVQTDTFLVCTQGENMGHEVYVVMAIVVLAAVAEGVKIPHRINNRKHRKNRRYRSDRNKQEPLHPEPHRRLRRIEKGLSG
jgi:hypothetical protein